MITADACLRWKSHSEISSDSSLRRGVGEGGEIRQLRRSIEVEERNVAVVVLLDEEALTGQRTRPGKLDVCMYTYRHHAHRFAAPLRLTVRGYGEGRHF